MISIASVILTFDVHCINSLDLPVSFSLVFFPTLLLITYIITCLSIIQIFCVLNRYSYENLLDKFLVVMFVSQIYKCCM